MNKGRVVVRDRLSTALFVGGLGLGLGDKGLAVLGDWVSGGPLGVREK